MPHKLDTKLSSILGVGIILGMLFLTMPTSSYAMFGGYHAFDTSLSNDPGGTPVDIRWVEGSVFTPSPTLDNNSHKDYMVYVTTPLDDFTAGSGVYLQKSNNVVSTCYLKLFYTDAAPNLNFHMVTCSPSPSGIISVKIAQPTNGVNTWQGTSGGLSSSWTGTSAGGQQALYYGAVVGSTTDNRNLYSWFANLKVKDWTTGTLYDFSASPGLFKCDFDFGYNYLPSSDNAFETGPPTITTDNCADSAGFRPAGGEW